MASSFHDDREFECPCPQCEGQETGPQHLEGGLSIRNAAEASAAEGPAPRDTAAEDAAACASPSLTHRQGSQEGWEAVFSLDWLQTSGCIEWDRDKSWETFRRLDQLQQEAKESRKPVELNLAGCPLRLHASGMGSGNQSRLEYRMDWGGVLLAFSERKNPDRHLNNFHMKISGEPCLLFGVAEVLRRVREIIDAMGGVIVDEWVQRLDFCLDVVGCDLVKELYPAVAEERVLATAKHSAIYRDGGHPTGFSFGKHRLKLRVYDKLSESLDRHGEYLQGMIERRWGGRLPAVATRVEYQVSREWLVDKGIDTLDQVLNRLPDIVGKITSTGPRPFVCLTDRQPDRENKHQGRVEVLPAWSWIVNESQRLAGPPREHLKPVDRGAASFQRQWSMARGILMSIAARMGRMIENVRDVEALIRDLDVRHGGMEEKWFDIWAKKARELGTLDRVLRFRPEDLGDWA